MIIVTRAHVFSPTVGHDLEEPGAGAGADVAGGNQRAPQEMENIVVVSALGRQTVSPGALANAGVSLAPALMRVDRVLVIFADEDERQLFQDGEVQAFGKNALLGGTVAKKTDDDGVLLANLECIGISESVGNGRSNHGGGPHHAGLGGDQVH